MEDDKLKKILDRYRNGAATSDDRAFLESWYLKYNQSDPFIMDDEDRINDVDLVYAAIKKNQDGPPQINLWYRMSVAGVILIFLSFGGYFLVHPKNGLEINSVQKNDISPGKNKATLTLASGKKIVLSDQSNGRLTNEAGVTINKTKNGELIYTVHAATGSASSVYNTLETARGEQYQVALPDGSHVWLNVASSLRYPIAFAGHERVVELTGEAYFEVVHNKAMPFKVKTQQQEVEVLGTHFNINAYTDEKVTATTLIEGSVKVTLASNHNSTVISPGQQSVVSNTDLGVQQVATDEAVAWKNGYFQFSDETLESIMRKVSRWYNIEIEYKDNSLRQQVFTGTVSRYKNISQVIKTLELTNAVHFKIEDNKIVVMN